MISNILEHRKMVGLSGAWERRSEEPVVLVNGLAEQSESWFANRHVWSRDFDVLAPEILAYGGDALHRHIDSGGAVNVEYLTGRLSSYLEEFVQRPPYNLIGSSLGGQVIMTYAARNPEKVARIVMFCPSGLHGDENLPMMEGVRRSRYDSLVGSVFHSRRFATEGLVQAVAEKFRNRRWKKGVLRTLRGTVGHSVEHLIDRVPHRSLIFWGAEDRVLSDVEGSIKAASRMPDCKQVVIPRCGHAPQIERSRTANRLVARFLKDDLKHVPQSLRPEPLA